MKSKITILAVFAIFLLIVAIEANAATFSNIFKLFSKNSTTAKTTAIPTADTKMPLEAKTSVDTKSDDTKAEDKSAFKKESREKDASAASKDKTDMDIKAKSAAKTGDTKASEKAKDSSKTQSKWKVTDDGKLKIDGKANSVCISLPDQTITPEDSQVEQKQYEFRSGKVECTGGFFTDQTRDDPALEVIECTPVELKAKCREGVVLNYGGSCSYGDSVDLDNRGIEKLTVIPPFFNVGWDDLPSSNEVMIRCNTGLNIEPRGMGIPTTNPIAVEKTLYITCVREKS